MSNDSGTSGNQAVFANWNSPSQPPGAATSASLGPAPNFRSAKDSLPSGYRPGVETQYPDGYLGPMEGNRRADKVLGHIERMNLRQYSRGVHKGERVNPSDYLWPEEFNKFTGLKYEQMGMKFAPAGSEAPRLTNDGKISGSTAMKRAQPGSEKIPTNPERQSRLRHLMPLWR